MASIRQIQANQLNAQHSTGPITAPGKAVVAKNALKSGIDARSLIIEQVEDISDFRALRSEYFARWIPTTPEQRALVDILISNEWLLRRYRRIEPRLFELAWPHDTELDGGSCIAQGFHSAGKTFDRLNRHRNAAQRNFQSALRDLQRLKKEELAAPEPLNPPPIAYAPPQPVQSAPASTPIGFVPPTAASAQRDSQGQATHHPVAQPLGLGGFVACPRNTRRVYSGVEAKVECNTITAFN